jgi:hypothetical protein
MADAIDFFLDRKFVEMAEAQFARSFRAPKTFLSP